MSGWQVPVLIVCAVAATWMLALIAHNLEKIERHLKRIADRQP